MTKWFKCERLGIEVKNLGKDMTYKDATKSLKRGEWLIEDFEACLVFRTLSKELNIIIGEDYWNKDINGVGRVSWLYILDNNSNFIAEGRYIDSNVGSLRGVIVCRRMRK